MGDINIWDLSLSEKQITELQEYIDLENCNKKYLLDTKKEKFTLYEKCVYDIAMYQFKRLNIDYDENKHYIEFWSYNEITLNDFYINCDDKLLEEKNIFINPLLSNILYLNNEQLPICITNIDEDKLLYKKFDKEETILLSFPRINKLLSFDNKTCYGSTYIYSKDDLYKCNKKDYTIMINLWDRKINKEYYNTSNNANSDVEINKMVKNNIHKQTDRIIDIKKNNDTIHIIYVDDIFTQEIFEDLIYNKKNVLYVIGEIVKEKIFNDIHYKGATIILKKKISNIRKEYIEAVEKSKINKENVHVPNKLYQRFLKKNIFSKEICKWILYEIMNNENDGEKNENYKKEINELPFYKLIMIYLQKLLDNMVELYKLDNAKIDVDKIYITKSNDSRIEIKDEGKLTLNILLSDIVNEIIFEDGIKYKQESGDILYYSGEIMNYSEKYANIKYNLFFVINY